MQEPEDEPSGFIDRALDVALHGFQRDKGLRVDGFMRPGGPTERSLPYDLRGLFGKGAGLESARDDGLDSLGRGQGSFAGGSFYPPSALRADTRDAGQDEGRSSSQSTLDEPLSERAPRGRGGGFSLLDVRAGRGGTPTLALRHLYSMTTA
jgi:hypothetical protein